MTTELVTHDCTVSAMHFWAGDGTRLSAWEVRRVGEARTGPGVALLVHGNGLNGRCWLPVALRLARRGWECAALDMRGHGSSDRSPGDDYKWSLFAEDVAHVAGALARRFKPNPIMGIGHSAGASALLMAEASRPGLLCCIWAYEPIMVVPGSNLRQVRSPELAARARRRRDRFESPQDARRHFSGRGAFAEWSPEALDAYIEGGLGPSPEGGLELACRPEVEARVYEAAGNHDVWPLLDQLHPPLRLVGGADSPAVPPNDLEAIAARATSDAPFIVPGLGHFGPFARPDLMAIDIEHFAECTGCSGRPHAAGPDAAGPDAAGPDGGEPDAGEPDIGGPSAGELSQAPRSLS